MNYVLNLLVLRTFEFRPYLDTLRNGTSVIVKTAPPIIPPKRPTKCCCHGSVPIPNIHKAKNSNFISAIYGLFNCFQWINISSTVIDDTIPAIAANGPT